MPKHNEPALDLPTSIADDTDDFFLDFTDVEASSGFEPLAAGWYPMLITGWKEQTVKNFGGKANSLPIGTKGTQFEFTVMDGHEKAKRKVWNTYWHSKENLGYFKGVLKSCGQFTDEQINGKLSVAELRDGAVGGQVMVRLTIKAGNEQYGPQNQIAQVKAYDEALANIAAPNADLPG